MLASTIATRLVGTATQGRPRKKVAAANPAKVRELEAMWTRHMEATKTLAFTDPPPPDANPKKGKRAK